MKSVGVILIIIGLFLAITIGSNIYYEMKPPTDEDFAKALFGVNPQKYTYKPPFTTHEIVNIGLASLGIISFFGGIGLCSSSSNKKES